MKKAFNLQIMRSSFCRKYLSCFLWLLCSMSKWRICTKSDSYGIFFFSWKIYLCIYSKIKRKSFFLFFDNISMNICCKLQENIPPVFEIVSYLNFWWNFCKACVHVDYPNNWYFFCLPLKICWKWTKIASVTVFLLEKV